MDEQHLRRLLRLGRQPNDQPGRRCPDDNTIAAYADHRLPDADAAQVESHLADCAACLEQVSILMRCAESATSPVAPEVLRRARQLVGDGRSRWKLPVLRWGAAAATAACVLLAVSLQMRAPRMPLAPEPTPPGVSAPAASSSVPAAPPATVQPAKPAGAVRETAPTPRPPVRRARPAPLELALLAPGEGTVAVIRELAFEWRAVGGAAYYEVHLVSPEGNVVWVEKVEGTSATPPGGVPLEAGKTYFVWVRAFLSGGGTVKSPAVSFRLAGR